MELDSKIPTGTWTLYYHDPSDTRWTPESYQKIGSFDTYSQFFVLMKELGDIAIKYGMLFIMKDGIPPLYENFHNIRGGSYSLRIARNKSVQYFYTYTLACFVNDVVNNKDNIIQGISISPKRVNDKSMCFNVIKIWNKDCQTFNKGNELISYENIQSHSEIIYTPHVQRKI